MDYNRLNHSIQDIINYNLNLANLSTYIEPIAYNKCATPEYIQTEYLKFERWLDSFIDQHPLTKNIQVVNFRVKLAETHFLIEVSFFDRYSAKDATWSQKILSTFVDDTTKNLLQEMTPSKENADEAFIIVALLVTFMNQYAKTKKKNLTKDRSIFGIYPTLRLAMQYDEASINIVKAI